jgi:hypothetical protein
VCIGLCEDTGCFQGGGLREGDGDDGGLTAEFEIGYCECCGTYVCFAEEGEMEGDCVRLVLR